VARKIEVSIGDDGQVEVEFIGFAGDDCFDEAERLQDVLARMGLKVDVQDIVTKSAAQIEEELGIEAEEEEVQVRGPGE